MDNFANKLVEGYENQRQKQVDIQIKLMHMLEDSRRWSITWKKLAKKWKGHWRAEADVYIECRAQRDNIARHNEKLRKEVAKMKQIVEMAQKVASINYGELITVLPEILRLREVLDDST